MLSKEEFTQRKVEQLASNIEFWADVAKKNHFFAHPLVDVVSIAIRPGLSDSEYAELYAQAHERAITELAKHGIMADIYNRRGDNGSGSEAGRTRVRVYERDGRPTGVMRLGIGKGHVDQAYTSDSVSAADLKLKNDVE